MQSTCAAKRKRKRDAYESEDDEDQDVKPCPCCINAREWKCHDIPEWISIAKCVGGVGSVHHSKGALLFTCDSATSEIPRHHRISGIRVVVSTGNTTNNPNFINASWSQHFPLKQSNQARVVCSFEDTICTYFSRLEATLDVNGPSMSPLPTLFSSLKLKTGHACACAMDTLGSFDYSDAHAHLIASVPGTYDADCNKFGHKLVAKHLRAYRKDHGGSWSERDAIIIHQTSMGTGIDAAYYFGEFLASLQCSKTGTVVDKVIWPSEERVHRNAGAACHFGSEKAFQDMGQDGLLAKSLYEYEGAKLAHMKVYCRVLGDNASELGWLWLTSANLSRGAQGIVEVESWSDCSSVGSSDEARACSIRNWELGVLFVPENERDCMYAAQRLPAEESTGDCTHSRSFSIPFSLSPKPYRNILYDGQQGGWSDAIPYTTSELFFDGTTQGRSKIYLPWLDDHSSAYDDDESVEFVLAEGC